MILPAGATFLALVIVACGDASVVGDTGVRHLVTVIVTDAASQPLDGLTSSTIVRATSTVLPGDPADPFQVLGRYRVMDDADKDVLEPGDNVVDFLAWDGSQFATGTFVIVTDGGHVSVRDGPDTIVTIPSWDTSPIQTDSDVYTLERVSNAWGGAWRAYPIAIYRNTTNAPIHFARCTSSSTLPMWIVRRTGADSTRRLFGDHAWACVGGVPTGSIAPGDAVLVRVILGTVDQPDMQPPLQLEWLIGQMRVELWLCRGAVADSDDCVEPLPQAERQSNAFEVRF